MDLRLRRRQRIGTEADAETEATSTPPTSPEALPPHPSSKPLVQHDFNDEGIMNTLAQIMEISSRLDHLGICAEWIARETVHTDNSVSQTGTLMSVLTEDIREKINALIAEIEHFKEIENSH